MVQDNNCILKLKHLKCQDCIAGKKMWILKHSNGSGLNTNFTCLEIKVSVKVLYVSTTPDAELGRQVRMDGY